MSSAPPANAAPTASGSGRPKRPGWWWKRRKEKLKKQRQAAENASGVQETPAPAQNDPEAGIVVGAKKKKNKRRRRKNKKKARDDNPVQPEPARALRTEIVGEGQPIDEAELSEPESERIPEEPLEYFFAQYEGFDYEPSIAPTDEFRRLCDTMNWKRGAREAREAREDFGYAITSHFHRMYGKDKEDMSAWQKLCRRIGIDPIPDEWEEAKEKVYNSHVNLIDLTTTVDIVMKRFPSEKALSQYSRETGKIFPQSAARGTLLASLLRRINDPPPEGSRRDANNEVVT